MKVKNQKCIRRLSYKSLWASRKRNVIAIFAIALTTLLFTSLFTILMSLNASYETYNFRQAGGYADGTFKELSEDRLSEALAAPHNRVRIMVDDHGYILVAFLVAGLINTNVHQPVKAAR